MDAATLIPLAIEIAITGVISALFLWGADVLLKYDAGFPALLFASVVAAGVDQIPYFGSYLQWLFFLGIVYKFGRLMIIDALWLAVIAFVMKMLLLLVVMSYLGKKMGEEEGLDLGLFGDPEMVNPDMLMVEEMLDTAEQIGAQQMAEEQRHAAEARRAQREANGRGSQPKPEPAKPRPPKHPQEAPASFRAQYSISAIAVKGEERFAVINGVVYREGAQLKNHFRVKLIEEERVQIEKDRELFWLYR